MDLKKQDQQDFNSESEIENDDESQSQGDIADHTNNDSILFLSDDEEIGIDESSEEERSRTPSASSASTAAHPILNNLILLSITTEKVNGRIKIMFSKERANTVLGEKQGDHVTSHRLFVELLNNKLKDAKISKIPMIILSTMEEIIPGFSLSELLMVPTEEDLKKTKFPLGIVKSDANKTALNLAIEKFERGDRLERVEKLNQFLSTVIQTYNQLEDVAYVRRIGQQGEKGKNEGTLTHQSVCTLQAIDEFLKTEQTVNLVEKQTQQLELFCKLLARNGEYCHGAILLFDKSKIEEVRQEFSIPKDGLDSDDIKKRLDRSAKIRQGTKIPDFDKFHKTISKKSLDVDILARLFNNCFDFQYYDAQASDSKKTVHETRRDKDKSDPEKLYNLALRHILIIFKAFPQLKDLNTANIIERFTYFLYQDQKWKDSQTKKGKASVQEIYEGIIERVDFGKLQIKQDSDFVDQIATSKSKI
jgi:hypothetical protein